MQYVPGIQSTHDLNVDHEGYKQHVCSVNSTSGCSPNDNATLFPLLTTHVLLNTEVIKHTILAHEAIFRHQVIELHHLYVKQRELMNELRSDLNRQNTQVKLASSECGWIEQKQSSVLWLNPRVSQPVAHVQSLQLDVCKKIRTDRGMHQVERTSRQCEMLDARCKKYNNKLLDLQLLATEYMDDDNDRFSDVAEATHPVRNTSPLSETNDEPVDHQPQGLDNQEKGLHGESVSAHPIFFDLNEPLNFEEAAFLICSDYGAPITCNEELLYKDISRKTKQVGSPAVHESDTNIKDHNNYDHRFKLSYDHEAGQRTSNSKLLNQELNPDNFSISADSLSLKPKSCDEHPGINHSLERSSKKRTLNSGKSEGCLALSEKNTQNTLITVPKSLQLIPIRNKTETHSKHVFSSVQSIFDFRRNPIAVQALPCTNAAVLIKKKKSKLLLKAKEPDVDTNQLCELLHHKPLANKRLLSQSVGRIKKGRKSEKGRNRSRVRNLNQDSYQLGISTPRVPMKFAVDSFPKAPLSPENEECSPPREESDENLLETRSHFYTMEDGDTQADEAIFAAKAIVFLSEADVHINRCSLVETSYFSPDNPLHWFAEVVSVDNTIEGLPPSGDSLFDDLDYFETMTLKLEDNTEEQYISSIEKLPLVTRIPGRARRARGRRSRKLKDFQGVVLPDISSLSRHEVNEDLQLIEGLMEAAGAPRIFGLKKSNRCDRGRKQLSDAASVIAENSPCLLLDLQNKSNEYQNSERRPMIVWGEITRRRRGQRYPARKLTFSRVAPTLRAH